MTKTDYYVKSQEATGAHRDFCIKDPLFFDFTCP